MDARAARNLAIRVVFVLYLLGLLVWLGLGLVPMPASHPDPAHAALDATTGLETTVEYAFSALNLALGVLLFVRRPDELVPRLLAFAMLGTAATFNLPSHRAFHVIGSPWPVAVVHFTFHLVSGVAYVWAVVLFPDGSLPRRVRPQPGVLPVVVLGTTGVVALACWRGSFLDHPQFFLAFFGIAVSVLGVAAQLLRVSDARTTPRDRATSRLLCAALLPALATALVWLAARAVGGAAHATSAQGVQLTVERLFPAVFAVVPVVLFAGIVRYRLWDIDRLLSRVLVYGLLGLAMSAAYVLAVAAGGWLAGGGLWVTALVLSLAAVLVEPLRTIGRRWANRVVFGQVLSPSEAIRSLAGSLEHLTPTGELDHVVDVAVAATRASSAELWLIDGDGLVRAATTRGGEQGSGEVALTGPDRSVDVLAAAVGSSQGWAVRHQGQLLGLLCARAPTGSRLGAADDAVGADIAAHAGLLVHNATLTVTLARQVAALAAQAEELAASRRRVVTAQDAERRDLERALHDGAQQALVAAVIGARACAMQMPVPRDAAEELREVLVIARRDVDELSGDGRPATLERLGLAGSLEAAAQLARTTGLDVQVHVSDATDLPMPTEVETAVYFACVEGVQNATKYAAARRATVTVHHGPSEVMFSVADDGTGFNATVRGPADVPGHGGLVGLELRLAALGGRVSVTSRVGAGTVLQGSVPLRAGAEGES